MRVGLRLYAGLRRYMPEVPLGQTAPLDLPEGSTIAAVLEMAGVPAREAKAFFVNGVKRGLDHVLEEGDEVALFPPVGGGHP